MSTLLLDRSTWDLVLDANNNIAVATEPYSLAQDAASEIKVFLGECYWDTDLGVPYLTEILGHSPPLALLKQLLVNAALLVPGVVSAEVFITELRGRILRGQVQVTSAQTGRVTAASFSVINPQGG